jgi:hypothetical protein
MTTRDAILIVIIVLALIGTAYFLFMRPKASDAPKDQFVDLECQKCKARFQISEYEADQILQRGEFKAGARGQMSFKCKKCNEFAAVRPNEAPEEEPPPAEK